MQRLPRALLNNNSEMGEGKELRMIVDALTGNEVTWTRFVNSVNRANNANSVNRVSMHDLEHHPPCMCSRVWCCVLGYEVTLTLMTSPISHSHQPLQRARLLRRGAVPE